MNTCLGSDTRRKPMPCLPFPTSVLRSRHSRRPVYQSLSLGKMYNKKVESFVQSCLSSFWFLSCSLSLSLSLLDGSNCLDRRVSSFVFFVVLRSKSSIRRPSVRPRTTFSHESSRCRPKCFLTYIQRQRSSHDEDDGSFRYTISINVDTIRLQLFMFKG